MNTVVTNDQMQMHHQCFLSDEASTLRAGYDLAQQLCGGMTVFLEGTLGAGKTTIAKGILQGMGYTGNVKSPTYTLVEPYAQLSPILYHFDLYRLGEPEELEYMGIRDYFSAQSLCLVEWPQRGKGVLPIPDITLQLHPQSCATTGKTGRQLTIWAAANQKG